MTFTLCQRYFILFGGFINISGPSSTRIRQDEAGRPELILLAFLGVEHLQKALWRIRDPDIPAAIKDERKLLVERI